MRVKGKSRLALLLILAVLSIVSVIACRLPFERDIPQPKITKPPVPPIPHTPLILYFNATPTQIVAGTPTTLEWRVIGATSTAIYPDIGNVFPDGIKIIQLTKTTTFKLYASNIAGTVTRSVTITIR